MAKIGVCKLLTTVISKKVTESQIYDVSFYFIFTVAFAFHSGPFKGLRNSRNEVVFATTTMGHFAIYDDLFAEINFENNARPNFNSVSGIQNWEVTVSVLNLFRSSNIAIC